MVLPARDSKNNESRDEEESCCRSRADKDTSQSPAGITFDHDSDSHPRWIRVNGDHLLLDRSFASRLS